MPDKTSKTAKPSKEAMDAILWRKLVAVAELMDIFKVSRRMVLFVWLYICYKTVYWIFLLPDPTIVQSGIVGLVFSTMGVVFAFYSNRGFDWAKFKQTTNEYGDSVQEEVYAGDDIQYREPTDQRNSRQNDSYNQRNQQQPDMRNYEGLDDFDATHRLSPDDWNR